MPLPVLLDRKLKKGRSLYDKSKKGGHGTDKKFDLGFQSLINFFPGSRTKK